MTVGKEHETNKEGRHTLSLFKVTFGRDLKDK